MRIPIPAKWDRWYFYKRWCSVTRPWITFRILRSTSCRFLNPPCPESKDQVRWNFLYKVRRCLSIYPAYCLSKYELTGSQRRCVLWPWLSPFAALQFSCRFGRVLPAMPCIISALNASVFCCSVLHANSKPMKLDK